jgi:hypothetical protein
VILARIVLVSAAAFFAAATVALATPSKDLVAGAGATAFSGSFSVAAHSEDGVNPTGILRTEVLGVQIVAPVACAVIVGNRAAVVTEQVGTLNGSPQYRGLVVEDNSPLADRAAVFSIGTSPNVDPSTLCAFILPSSVIAQPLVSGNIVVHDN